jgi:hypothetical protein
MDYNNTDLSKGARNPHTEHRNGGSHNTDQMDYNNTDLSKGARNPQTEHRNGGSHNTDRMDYNDTDLSKGARNPQTEHRNGGSHDTDSRDYNNIDLSKGVRNTDRWDYSNVELSKIRAAGDSSLLRDLIRERKMFGSSDTFFEYRYPSPYGHKYHSYNFVGTSPRWTDEQVFSPIQRHLCSYLVCEPIGTNDDSIVVGKRFYVYFYVDYGRWFKNEVKITDLTKKSFEVATEPNHRLQGTVVHEIIKESDGEFWLHQSGRGVDREYPFLQEETYSIAPEMWRAMAIQIGRQIFGRYPVSLR